MTFAATPRLTLFSRATSPVLTLTRPFCCELFAATDDDTPAKARAETRDSTSRGCLNRMEPPVVERRAARPTHVRLLGLSTGPPASGVQTRLRTRFADECAQHRVPSDTLIPARRTKKRGRGHSARP